MKDAKTIARYANNAILVKVKEPLLLVINPGSTSTRTALFRGEVCLAREHLEDTSGTLAKCERIADQVPYRLRQVEEFVVRTANGENLAAIAARGGSLRPIPGGVYRVNPAMCEDARSTDFIEHASKAACLIADELARKSNIPAFVVDAVSTDEYAPISRISGLRECPRRSLTHALNMKFLAHEYAREIKRDYADLNLITAHLGGGISIAVHHGGRMIDSVDANGEGPFSPERSGGLRVDDLLRLAAADHPDDQIPLRQRLTRQGGLTSHFGTADMRALVERVESGDEEVRLVLEAMAYQIAKHLYALAAAVNGRLDGILLTGGLAHAKLLVGWIRERVEFLAPVRIIPGEREMEALCAGTLRVLSGKEKARVYPSGDFSGC